jgi:signal transduction histidine kinase
LVVPIKARDRIYGALSFVFTESGRTYSAEDLPLAEGLALRAGVAVDNALLYQAAQQEIAERKRAEEEVQRLNLELEDRVRRRTAALQETNEQLEAFTYTVAHDLRAPLRAMQGFSQALLEDYSAQLGASGQDYASRVIAAAQRMDALIQDLLAYSRLSRSHLTSEAVDLEPIVERVLLNFHTELRAKDAQVDLVRPLPRVRAHPNTLEHIVMNLVSNALKFVANGVQPRLRIWAECQDNAVRVVVEDNGIGIADDHHERIFRVFERLHGTESFSGTGIGLAIVKKGIERMGGVVGVDSQPGRGSVFWFELPKAQ